MHLKCIWSCSARFSHTFSSSQLRVRLATATDCRPKPNQLVFGKDFTDHMLKVYWHKSLGGWQEPEIVPLENLSLHPAAKVFHYAIELFEGLKAYRGADDRIRLFRPDLNMERMNRTAARATLPTFDGNELIECIRQLIVIDQEWVPHEGDSTLYVRPSMIGIEPTLGIANSDSALLFVVLCPVGDYFKDGVAAVSLLADPQYTRAWPGGVGDRKMGSNYGPTIHVQNAANAINLNQVLWLYGEDHQITEVGTMNFFMLFINDNGERELRTPPLNGLILPGITRDSILELTRSWCDFVVTEEQFTMPEVVKLLQENRVLEMFGTGTACVVSPINRIQYLGEDYKIPTMDQAAPVFEIIKDQLLNIQFGIQKHPWAVDIC